jgi:hypothetical protein
MTNDGDLTPEEAAVKAFETANLQSKHAPCSHGPMGRPFQERSSQNGSQRRGYRAGFTLAEVVVTIGVLALLVLLFTQLLNNAASITTLGHKEMDADSQARQLLDRMALDLAQMVKRTDVDFFAKGMTAPNSVGGAMAGNDQIAFYSAVPGYYPPTGSQSPVSLVAYRVNSASTSPSYNKMERMGKGLVWNGVGCGATPCTPVVFMPLTIGPSAAVPLGTWPAATSSSTSDPAYEVIGPQVFRFEYCYLQTDGTLSVTPPGVSSMAAIVVDIAVIDPKSKALLDTVDPTGAKLARLNGADGQSQGPALIDWGNTSCLGCPTQTQWQTTPGLLRNNWQNTLNGIATLPRPALSGIRLYERSFYLSPPAL